MSARLVEAVWNSSLPVALKPYAAVLAGFASDDGSRVYPSIALVAWKVGVTDRRAQAAISKLTTRGVLRVVLKHAPGRPTRYVFDETALPSRPALVVQQLALKFNAAGVRPNLTPASPEHLTPASPASEFSTGIHRTSVTAHLTYTSSKPDVGDVKPDVYVSQSVSRSVSDPSVEEVPALIAPLSAPALRAGTDADAPRRHADATTADESWPALTWETPDDAPRQPALGNPDVCSDVRPGARRAANASPRVFGGSDGAGETATSRVGLSLHERSDSPGVSRGGVRDGPTSTPQQQTLGPLDVSPTQARASPQWQQIAAVFKAALEQSTEPTARRRRSG